MSTETHSSSVEAQPTIEQLALSSDAEVASTLERCSAAVIEQLLGTLITRMDVLARDPDQPEHSGQYDRLNAVLDQVRARRGYQSMDEAV